MAKGRNAAPCGARISSASQSAMPKCRTAASIHNNIGKLSYTTLVQVRSSDKRPASHRVTLTQWHSTLLHRNLLRACRPAWTITWIHGWTGIHTRWWLGEVGRRLCCTSAPFAIRPQSATSETEVTLPSRACVSSKRHQQPDYGKWRQIRVSFLTLARTSRKWTKERGRVDRRWSVGTRWKQRFWNPE